MALKLLNGKFYDDGNIVPLEFGNWEQIRLIQAEIKKLECSEEQEALSESYDNKLILNNGSQNNKSNSK